MASEQQAPGIGEVVFFLNSFSVPSFLTVLLKFLLFSQSHFVFKNPSLRFFLSFLTRTCSSWMVSEPIPPGTHSHIAYS